MAPRKRLTGGTTSKGKAKAITGGTTSKLINNQSLADGTASILSREPTTSSQPSQQQKDQSF